MARDLALGNRKSFPVNGHLHTNRERFAIYGIALKLYSNKMLSKLLNDFKTATSKNHLQLCNKGYIYALSDGVTAIKNPMFAFIIIIMANKHHLHVRNYK